MLIRHPWLGGKTLLALHLLVFGVVQLDDLLDKFTGLFLRSEDDKCINQLLLCPHSGWIRRLPYQQLNNIIFFRSI